MNRLHLKAQRRIRGTVAGKRKDLMLSYFFSFSFAYMVVFASLNYFMNDSSILINTFGVVAIDVVASLFYCMVYTLHYKRKLINAGYYNKKIEVLYKFRLLREKMSEVEKLTAFKLIIFFIVTFFVMLYYSIGGALGVVEYMSLRNAFQYAMFFLSTAYFPLFFKSRFRKYIPNFELINELNAGNKLTFKIGFYIFIFFVLFYQLYVLISNAILLFRTF